MTDRLAADPCAEKRWMDKRHCQICGHYESIHDYKGCHAWLCRCRTDYSGGYASEVK